MLHNYCLIYAMYCNRYIKNSVSFSGSLWIRKNGLPVFSFQFPFGQKMMVRKRIIAQEMACLHGKKHTEHHHIVFMFKYEVLSEDVD